ncbi:MAG TPA: hypothetical protein VL727_12140, partial [Puia sp.]|nr:hypothetical protein [Puia sp.]
MTNSALDLFIAELGKALLLNDPAFETIAERGSVSLQKDDLIYLRVKLHYPPSIAPEINESELRLGEWLAICQHAIFELIYRIGIDSVEMVRSIAFGEYDWIQANALEVLCRFCVDGMLSISIISEIDLRLPKMRNETVLYFAQALANRRERDERFDGVIKQIKNTDFRLALAELGFNEPMSREELIELGKRIVTANEDEEEIKKLMELFDRNISLPNGSDLFFAPSAEGLTIEEIIDKCLNK